MNNEYRIRNNECQKVIQKLCAFVPYASMPFIVCFLSLCLFFDPAWAGEKGKVLILNSDSSVEKYFLAQSEFKPKLAKRIVKVDLGSEWTEESKIKRLIKAENPEVIYCIGSKAYQTAYKYGKMKNIIFSSIIKWRRLPLGSNTYGVALELPPGMQLMTYRYLFPEIKKIGVLYSKTYSAGWLKRAKEAAREVGMEIIAERVKNSENLESALKKLLPEVDVLWLTSDPIVLSGIKEIKKIFQESDAMKKPVFAYDEVFADFGALLVISADIPTIGGQVAGLVDDIISGETGMEKVQSPAGSHITLNTKKVEEYGVKLREGALNSVNRIIK